MKVDKSNNWRCWELTSWNDALVRGIAFGVDMPGRKIVRIESSARFLARITGDIGCQPEDAKKLFVAAFGKSERTIKDQFSADPAELKKRDPEIFPNFVAALYLSLLAASADNETAGEGNFRQRFAEISGVPRASNWSFDSLPSMWKCFSQWTNERAKVIGDCGVLELPDPLHETRIGHSKRLAFPAFRDEQQLRNVLSESDFDDSPSVEDVLRSLMRKQSFFTQNFINELDLFRQCVTSGDIENAELTPLWGAIQSITSVESSFIQKQNGVLTISIDVTDSLDSRLWVLIDKDLESKNIFMSKRVLAGACKKESSYVTDAAGEPIRMDDLARVVSRDSILRRTKIGRKFQHGWFLLFPSAGGVFSSSGSYFEGADICLLTKKENLLDCEFALRELGILFHAVRFSAELGEWRVIFLSAVNSEGYFGLVNTLIPTALRGYFRGANLTSRLSITGGVWLGQSALLNPATDLRANFVGATAGTFKLLDQAGLEIITGDLKKDAKGFLFPANCLAAINENITRCEIELASDKLRKKEEFPVITRSIDGNFAIVKHAGSWWRDGETGVLTRRFFHVEKKTKRLSLDVVGKALFPPRILINDADAGIEAVANEIDYLPPHFEWLAEALSQRFQERGHIPYGMLKEYVSGAAQASGLKEWTLRNALFSGRWTSSLISPNFPAEVVVPAPREMTIRSMGGRTLARLTGLFGIAALRKIKAILAPGETAWRLQALKGESIGAIECHVATVQRAEEIALVTRSRIIDKPDGPALNGLTPPNSDINVTFRSPRLHEFLEWNHASSVWNESTGSEMEWSIGGVRKIQGTEKNEFWVRIGSEIYARTDSFRWAMMLAAVIRKSIIAKRTVNGEIVWPNYFGVLPESVSRWWMLFGGGCVSHESSRGLFWLSGTDPVPSARVGFVEIRGHDATDGLKIARARWELARSLRLRARRKTR
jgi:hypothetical protein